MRVRDHASQADIDDDALAADDRGLLQTEELCSFTNDDCFIPSLIGGDERVMECGVDGKEPYAMGIRSGAVECTSGGFSPCQEGEFFVGGGCRSAEEATGVARCPAATFSPCPGWPAINLPEAVVGEVRNNVQTGWSHYTNYRCSSVTRQWRRVSDNGGYCNCTDLNLPGEREACDGWFGEGEGTFTGDVTYDFTRVCDPDVGYPQDDWTNIDETACQCAGPINEVWPESCPAGFQGQAQWRRTWTCNTATSGSWSEWELDQSGCTCTPRTEERERSCPGGFPGAILERSTMTCPSSVDGEVTWSEWEEISNTCSCTVSTQNRNASCPAGTTGTVTESRTRSCPSATWSDWTVTATNCTCQPQTIGPEQFPCPQGYTGYILKTQQVTCPGPVFGPWTNVPDGNNCQPIIYRWKAIGTATQTGASSAWGSPVNSQCSPQGARDRCHRVIPGGGGTVDNYAECECQ